MRILYIGPLWEGSTALQRLKAVENIGHLVAPIDLEYFFPVMYKGIHTLQRKLLWGPRVKLFNQYILKRAKQFEPEIVWIDKGLLINPKTLIQLKALPIKPYLIHYSPDDMMNPKNQNRYYLAAISLYNLHITTKTHNIDELLKIGAKDVYFIDKSYCSELHRPLHLTNADKIRYGHDVSFVGAYERERAESILTIANAGISVRVWGPGWNSKKAYYHQKVLVEQKPVWGQEYVYVINASKINLCFLRKANRDAQTARSIEIPACKAFMLGEQTEEHLRLFKENVEACFFSDDKELVDKIRYYIDRNEERENIASCARTRCEESGYSYSSRFRMLFSNILEKKIP